jgi:hypothetical protein
MTPLSLRQQRILSACRLAYRQARVICGEAARIAEILPDRADRLKTRGEIRLARARTIAAQLLEQHPEVVRARKILDALKAVAR